MSEVRKRKQGNNPKDSGNASTKDTEDKPKIKTAPTSAKSSIGY